MFYEKYTYNNVIFKETVWITYHRIFYQYSQKYLSQFCWIILHFIIIAKSMAIIKWCQNTFPAWHPSSGDIPMYTGPDLPSADVPEELTAPEPQSVPVQVALLPLIVGYETTACYDEG